MIKSCVPKKSTKMTKKKDWTYLKNVHKNKCSDYKHNDENMVLGKNNITDKKNREKQNQSQNKAENQLQMCLKIQSSSPIIILIKITKNSSVRQQMASQLISTTEFKIAIIAITL